MMTKNDVTLESALIGCQKRTPSTACFWPCKHLGNWSELARLTSTASACSFGGHSRKGPYLPT